MGKKILVISPTPTHPQTAGNRARIYRMLTTLQKQGHAVTLLYEQRERGGDDAAMQQAWQGGYLPIPFQHPQPLLKRLWDRGLQKFFRKPVVYGVDAWYQPGLTARLVKLQAKEQFDVVLAEYIFLSQALTAFGEDVLKLLDTHDVFTDRHTMYLRHNLAPFWYSTSAAEEARGLERADVVLATSDQDAEFFAGLVQRPVVTIGHLVDLFEPLPPRVPGHSLLFVGSENPINVQGLEDFLSQTFPLIRQAVPQARLVVLGGAGKGLPKDAAGVSWAGISTDLRPYYQAADVVINPVQFGTGLSIKMIEALGHARPVVTTTVGARGLSTSPGAAPAFLSGDTPEAFASAVTRVLRNEMASRALSLAAYAYARDWNAFHEAKLAAVLEMGKPKAESAGG